MNVHPQISALHVQSETIDPLPHRLSFPKRNSAALGSGHRAASKLRTRMQFTVDEDQVLVLRRVLIHAAGLCLKDMRITAIKSKHIAKVAIDIESSVVDHIFRTVIYSMHQVELGQISAL
jgi:hypothetical protein